MCGLKQSFLNVQRLPKKYNNTLRFFDYLTHLESCCWLYTWKNGLFISQKCRGTKCILINETQLYKTASHITQPYWSCLGTCISHLDRDKSYETSLVTNLLNLQFHFYPASSLQRSRLKPKPYSCLLDLVCINMSYKTPKTNTLCFDGCQCFMTKGTPYILSPTGSIVLQSFLQIVVKHKMSYILPPKTWKICYLSALFNWFFAL